MRRICYVHYHNTLPLNLEIIRRWIDTSSIEAGTTGYILSWRYVACRVGVYHRTAIAAHELSLFHAESVSNIMESKEWSGNLTPSSKRGFTKRAGTQSHLPAGLIQRRAVQHFAELNSCKGLQGKEVHLSIPNKNGRQRARMACSTGRALIVGQTTAGISAIILLAAWVTCPLVVNCIREAVSRESHSCFVRITGFSSHPSQIEITSKLLRYLMAVPDPKRQQLWRSRLELRSGIHHAHAAPTQMHARG